MIIQMKYIQEEEEGGGSEEDLRKNSWIKCGIHKKVCVCEREKD